MDEWYKKVVLGYYANFKGRATRSEYGYYHLFSIVIILIIGVLAKVFENNLALFFNLSILSLIMFVPLQAVAVRRLHDLGINGGFVFINFIPILGFFFSLYLLIAEGKRESNQYGSNPKYKCVFEDTNEVDRAET